MKYRGILTAAVAALLLLSGCAARSAQPVYSGLAAALVPAEQHTAESPEERTQNAQTENADTLTDLPPLVRIDDTLYCDTGRESTATGRCGTVDGEITSSVARTQIPTQNDQSNFGTGFAYQRGADGAVELSIDGIWYVFEPVEP